MFRVFKWLFRSPIASKQLNFHKELTRKRSGIYSEILNIPIGKAKATNGPEEVKELLSKDIRFLNIAPANDILFDNTNKHSHLVMLPKTMMIPMNENSTMRRTYFSPLYNANQTKRSIYTTPVDYGKSKCKSGGGKRPTQKPSRRVCEMREERDKSCKQHGRSKCPVCTEPTPRDSKHQAWDTYQRK